MIEDTDPLETVEWLESLDDVIARETPERVRYLLRQLQTRAHTSGIRIPFSANTPYINTIPVEDQPPFPVGHILFVVLLTARLVMNILAWRNRLGRKRRII